MLLGPNGLIKKKLVRFLQENNSFIVFGSLGSLTLSLIMSQLKLYL